MSVRFGGHSHVCLFMLSVVNFALKWWCLVTVTSYKAGKTQTLTTRPFIEFISLFLAEG